MLPYLLPPLALQAPTIVRDDYGVPHINASSTGEAFYQAGYAVAQDRLWQMEQSRRLARGRMAEVLGAGFVNSDKEVLQTGYTDEELQQQVDKLTPPLKEAFREYARGVNAWIAEAQRTNALPAGYATYKFAPEPWSVVDSAAIGVRLLQQFGRGGAGEIRNMAMLAYLKGQAKVKDRVLDVADDLIWWNDPTSVPTVSRADDPVKTPPAFYQPDRKTTERHVAMLPNANLFELLGGVRMAMREESTRIAELVAAPFKTGSYCVVVGPSRSATGAPILLSGPQMGFRSPSIVHEMSISAPGMQTVGMDIPGVPGIVVGHTRDLAWGLTSGVADTDDIFYYPADGPTGYRFGNDRKELVTILRTLKVAGAADQTVTQTRTVDGPVVLTSGSTKTLFAKRSSYWMRELESMNAWDGLWHAHTVDQADRAMQGATMNFNVFFATTGNEIGYRYAGLVPLRAPGVDPRFPTPGGPAYAWRGFVPADQMPHAKNPTAGFFANWNNKPVAWWPNFDTPVWGPIFRNTALLATLNKPKLNAQDLELAAWSIARTDETWSYFAPYVERWTAKNPAHAEPILGFDGYLLDGSRQAATYLRFIDALRQELFLGTTGNFVSPDNFRQAVQPSLILRALQGRTKVNYLAGRTADAVVAKAMERACAVARDDAQNVVRYIANGIPVKDQPPIPYSNRGTFIQVVEALRDGMSGRSVMPPGVAESGPHSIDQIPLTRAWQYKPMRAPWRSKGP
jgi:penicillin amidase